MRQARLELVAALLAAACAPARPIEAIGLRPIGDAKNWMLLEPLTYRVSESGDSIVVPAGFVTDFASIPPRLQSLISPLGPHLLPAVVHDYLYWQQGCSRAQADSLFLKAMTEMLVSRGEREAMYLAVSKFGGGAWTANQRDRKLGLPRIVPQPPRRMPGALETWPEYRDSLKGWGVAPDAQFPLEPGFCARGGPH